MDSVTYNRGQFSSLTGTLVAGNFYTVLEESSLGVKVAGVGISGNEVKIYLWQSLTSSEKTALDAIVSSHVGYTEPESLQAAKRVAKDLIDNAAGDARSKYMTVAAGQEAVYVLKENEAKRFISSGYPSAQINQFPHIKAESEATGLTYKQSADLLAGIALQWASISAAIERHRIGGKRQVDYATDTARIQEVVRDTLAKLRKV